MALTLTFYTQRYMLGKLCFFPVFIPMESFRYFPISVRPNWHQLDRKKGSLYIWTRFIYVGREESLEGERENRTRIIG